MAKLESIDPNENLEFKEASDAIEPNSLLANECMAQFRRALHHKRTMRVGDYTLHDLLKECYDARDDATLCSEADLAKKYPQWSQMPISIVSFKVNILVSLIRETLVDVASAPFIIDPTPKPEIPETKRDEVLGTVLKTVEDLSATVLSAQQQFIQMQGQNGVPATVAVQDPMFPQLSSADVYEILKKSKTAMYLEAKNHAQEQALLLQKDLYDKTTEGGYRRAIMEFADDFATYPFGCIHGPFPVVRAESKWRGDKFVEENNVIWAFERVSPFDLFWTADSSNTQDGTAVFIRKRVGYEYLYDCLQMAKDDPESGYDKDTIEDLLDEIKEGRVPRNWTEFNAKNPENHTGSLLWSKGETAEILIRYGKFQGFDLQEMGFTGLDEFRSYETKVILCGGQVIYCQLNKNPSQYKRPVFTASFEHRNGSIVGVGLGQKLLSLHKAYRAVVNLLMYNLGLSSEPITEVEVTRILEYMPDEWIDDPVINPGMVIPADGDRMGNGSRAVKFTQVPNTTDQALRLAQYIFELSHTVSNIPAALHGQPVGSGANRTVRGLLTLQGNTLKPIQSALINLDLGIIEPMVTLLYMLLVMYDNDFEYTGDCKVVAKGSASMVQREMDKQTAMENLQILGQLGQQVNPEIINRTVVELLTKAGVIEPGEDAILPMQAQAQPVAQEQPQPAPQDQAPVQ